MNDADAAVDMGYCYQYGIGTRRDPVRAKRMFKRAPAAAVPCDCASNEHAGVRESIQLF